jgi:hypothetical protein
MVAGIGFLLEIGWSSLVVNPARALFYSGPGTAARQPSMQR